MITYINGDIFTTDCKIIAHGCNCQGAYGAGIALTISKKYPKSKDAYVKKHHRDGWKLGEVQFVEENDKIIANCATQNYYGNAVKSKKVYADYKAIDQVFKTLYQKCINEDLTIAIPLIGSGLAGGDWKTIESIINSIFIDREIKVYVYKK